METRHVLVFDLGSSSIRALAVDELGRPLDETCVQTPYGWTTTLDGGVEIDADRLIDITLETGSRCLRETERLGIRPVAVGVSSFWHSLVGVSNNGTPVTPLLSWADTRSEHAARDLRRLTDETTAKHRTGCRFHSSYPPAKLLWLSRTRPESFSRVESWMSFPELLHFRLFGVRGCGVSTASGTGLFNRETSDWDDDLLSILGISRGHLSPILPDDMFFPGTDLKPPFSEDWTSLRPARFYPALGDGACGNLGSGCVGPKCPAINIGTSAAMRVVTTDSTIRPRPDSGLWRYSVDSERNLIGGALSNAGNVFAWMKKTFRLPDEDGLENALGRLPPDEHGLTILPFFAGERSPGWADKAKAAIVGMTLATTPTDIVRAALETVALRLAWIAEELEFSGISSDRFTASGRALVESPTWARIVCGALGKPLLRLNDTEVSARGAALWVWERMGVKPVQDFEIPEGVLFEPCPKAAETYRAALERHKILYRTQNDLSLQS